MTKNEFVALARTGGYSDARTIRAFVRGRDVFSLEDLVALHRLFVVSLGLRVPPRNKSLCISVN